MIDATDRQIDRPVYGLTEEEIAVVEGGSMHERPRPYQGRAPPKMCRKEVQPGVRMRGKGFVLDIAKMRMFGIFLIILGVVIWGGYCGLIMKIINEGGDTLVAEQTWRDLLYPPGEWAFRFFIAALLVWLVGWPAPPIAWGGSSAR